MNMFISSMYMTVLLLYVCKKEEIYGKPYIRHIYYVLVIPHLRVVSTNIYPFNWS